MGCIYVVTIQGLRYLSSIKCYIFMKSNTRFDYDLVMWLGLRLSISCPIRIHRTYRHQSNMAATTVNKSAHPFDKTRLEALLNRRFFYAPAFEIYGGTCWQRTHSSSLTFSFLHPGVAGLYDYGPPGSSLQANIISEWRKHFIVEDHMLELDTTIMTPAPVFETSGHVARFADWMVKDLQTGDVLRADHLVKNVLQARLAGNLEARAGVEAAAALAKGDEKDKKKKKAKVVAVALSDEVVKEYEVILAQVSDILSWSLSGAEARTD